MSWCPALLQRSESQHPQQHHFQTATWLGRPWQITPPVQGDLVEQLHVLGTQGIRQVLQALAIVRAILNCRGHHLYDRHPLQQRDELFEHCTEIRRHLGELFHLVEQRLCVAFGDGLQQPHHVVLLDGSEHHPHLGLRDLSAAVGDGLVQQTEGVAHAPIRGTRDMAQGGGLVDDPFLLQDPLQVPCDQLRRQTFEMKLQATRKDRDRQFLRVGGRQQELDVRRWLFERLQ